MSGVNFRCAAALTLLACSSLLAACGGGSGNGAPAPNLSSSGSSSGASSSSSSGSSSSSSSSGGSSSSSSGSAHTGSSPVSGLNPTAGTVAFAKNLSVDGQSRQVLYIRPVTASFANPPVLLMLTYPEGTPAFMANLTRAGRIAANYGAWVVIPAAGTGGKWSDNPADPAQTTDDVKFLATVIDDAASSYNLDRSRVYATGYSNSAFMVERVNCDRADLLAGAALIAATERNVVVPLCKPSRPVPAVFFLGTSDLVVPYNGLPTILIGAQQAYDNWQDYNGCTGSGTSSKLPTTANDGTSVQLQLNTACSAGSAVALYTINGGGHTWPGNQMGLIDALYLGPTTQNLDATLALWQFFTAR